jgi:hypothetical protein
MAPSVVHGAQVGQPEWYWGPGDDRDRHGWRRFISTSGSFSLRAPDLVKANVVLGGVLRAPADYHIFEFGSGAQFTFTLYYADIPSGLSYGALEKEALRWAIRTFVRDSEGSLVEDTGIVQRELGERGSRFPCRDAAVRVPDGYLTVRFCVVDGRLFELFTGSSVRERRNVLIDGFLGSFQVLNSD